MSKIKFTLKHISVLAIVMSSFIACDKDFATVGSDIIGQNNFGVRDTLYSVTAYTNPLGPVQTNNLPVNQLGVYKDPFYGLTTANFVSQMSSSVSDPEFGEGAIVDSVILTVPYYSRRVDANADNETIYELDSIFGNGAISLKFYENKYFLNSIDPNSEFNMPLNYFSNTMTSTGTINPELLRGEELLLDPDASPLDNFRFSNQEIELWNEDDEVTTRLAPALRVKLRNSWWKQKILDQEGESVLSNQNNFNNYFRGLYIEATSVSGNGSMALLNFAALAANITIYYSVDPAIVDGDRVQSTYVLNFNGNSANFISNQFDFSSLEVNEVTGDEKLYLKGGEGSTAVLDLFKSGTTENGLSPEFLNFKNKFVETDILTGKFIRSKRLVNEANLVFHVDQSLVNGNEPDRIYLYDLKNNVPLVDYYLALTNTVNPNESKLNHLGGLQREGGSTNGDGIKYKIKITEYINNLLLRDSTNVKLGLAVSTNVNLENGTPQYKILETGDSIVDKVPISSILSPKGTVLYGNNTIDEQKKLYLEIYFTEPNN